MYLCATTDSTMGSSHPHGEMPNHLQVQAGAYLTALRPRLLAILMAETGTHPFSSTAKFGALTHSNDIALDDLVAHGKIATTHDFSAILYNPAATAVT